MLLDGWGKVKALGRAVSGVWGESSLEERGMTLITLVAVTLVTIENPLFLPGFIAVTVLLGFVVLAPEKLRPGVWVIALTSGFIGYFIADGSTAEPAYFEAAAQIVPVFFIAIAIELRSHITDRSKPTDLRRAAAIVVLSLAMAEYYALHALAVGVEKAGKDDFPWTVFGLAAAGVGFALSIMLGPPEEERTEADPSERDVADTSRDDED